MRQPMMWTTSCIALGSYSSSPLWNYCGDGGGGDTQEEMDAYNEYNNGDADNGGPDVSTYSIGQLRGVPAGSFTAFSFRYSLY